MSLLSKKLSRGEMTGCQRTSKELHGEVRRRQHRPWLRILGLDEEHARCAGCGEPGGEATAGGETPFPTIQVLPSELEGVLDWHRIGDRWSKLVPKSSDLWGGGVEQRYLRGPFDSLKRALQKMRSFKKTSIGRAAKARLMGALSLLRRTIRFVTVEQQIWTAYLQG